MPLDKIVGEQEDQCKIRHGPPLEVSQSLFLCDYITMKIERYGNQIAQIDSKYGSILTYKQLADKSSGVSATLRHGENAVVSNEPVAIMGYNCIEYVWVLLGVLKAKASGVLINPEYTPREVVHNFSISKPTHVICSYSVAKSEHQSGITMAQVFASSESVKEVWVWGVPLGSKLPAPCQSLEDVMQEAANGKEYESAKESISTDNLTALILSSSGSTGLPKGVLLSNTAVIGALQTGSEYAKFGDISLGLMPFFHAYGLILMLMCLCEGACLVVMKKFAVDHFIATIQEKEIGNLYLVPSLLAILSKHTSMWGASNLVSVRHIWTGAGPVSNKLQATIAARFKNQAVMHHSYGLTETTFTMFAGMCRQDKPGSPGKLTPGIQCKVIDHESGTLLGPNQEGELCFRGPLMMSGYKGNVVATEETIDNEQWLHSGDLGYYDQDGYFYIVDRLKELIKYQGHQVSPSELESILITHPGVQDVAVMGIPHPVYGELTQALIVKQAGCKLFEAEIQDFLAVEVSPQKRLYGGVRFVDTIPKTPGGKILRRRLKDLYLGS